MKELLHDDPAADRARVTDVDAMRALAHRHRYAIFMLLLSDGPRTATQCAEVVGATPSACSYHLRELARFGFVERVTPRDEADDAEPVDGRRRPWRATASGFAFVTPTSDDTAGRHVHHALGFVGRAENERLACAFLEGFGDLDPAWQEASQSHAYGLSVTVEELVVLADAIDALLRPYRSPSRIDPPAGARVVHAVFEAFPRADLGRADR
ncbi:MAG: winged helix-turn-helix domain-containing protein [Ilumatobacteraceae bacterium]